MKLDSDTVPMLTSAYDRLIEKIQALQFHPCAVVMYVDLRQLRALNRHASPQHGDKVIHEAEEILSKWAGQSGVSARLWSNEFVAIKSIDRAQSAADEAETLRDNLMRIRYPSPMGENQLGVAIGMTVPPPGAAWGSVINDAAEACEIAKSRGMNQIYSTSAQKYAVDNKIDNAHLVLNFRRLLNESMLVLHPQPIMDISTTTPRIVKIEFLIRRFEGSRYMTLPAQTIETLEHFGLSSELDHFSSQFILEWLTQHPAVLDRLDSVSMNLSAKSIVDGNFIQSLYRDVKNAHLPGGKLCFEITETAAIGHLEAAAEVIHEFKKIGCRFSLDDFGSGLCSFGYLKSLPVDEVKIDGRFVQDLVENPISQEIVRAIHQVANATGKRTVAEFVDTADKLEVLRGIGIDYGQGWLFSPAVPPEQLLHML